MLNALYAIARCLSVTRVDQSKTVEVTIMKFLLHGSPIPLVFAGQVSSRNANGFPRAEASNKWGERHFLALTVSISKTVGDTSDVTSND